MSAEAIVMVGLGDSNTIPKDLMTSLDTMAQNYFDYNENRVRSMFTDPIQLAYFDRWLKGQEVSPNPYDDNLREVYDAIIDLAMVGCG